jgi:hypothetical protein
VKNVDNIVSLFRDRERHWGPIHAAGQALLNVYDGNHQVSLPELEDNERAAVNNLITTGVDAHAQRIASQEPVIDCPPLRTGNAALQRAANRKHTLQAWHYLNKMGLKRHKRARQLIALSMAPVIIRPGTKGYPVWEVRDPLTCFPAPGETDEIVPTDCVFEFRRTLRWLRMNYPNIAPRLLATNSQADEDTLFKVIQYIDSEQISLVALGEDGVGNHLLTSTENKAGRPLVIVPGRITLGGLQGQFDQMIGMYETSAKLWALHLHAVQRGIFGERWAVGDEVNIVTAANPYDGTVGHITGGDIKDVRTDPGFQQLNSIDRLEASQRASGAVPPELGGEGAGNVRTGRRGAQVLGAALDFPIQEHQDILAASLQEENSAAIAVAKAWFGNTQKTFAIPYLREPVTYTPNDTFDTDTQFVRYVMSGADSGGMVIEMGQRVAMETYSKQSFMEMDPAVMDADLEHDRLVVQGVEAAAMNQLLQLAADPAGPYKPRDLARLTELIIDKNMPFYQAVAKLDDELQEHQAAAAQGQLPPEQMQPGLGAEVGAPVGPPPSSMANLTQTLGNLRLQQRTSPAERAV